MMADEHNPNPALLARVPPSLQALARVVQPRRLERMLDVLDRRIINVAPVVEAIRRRHNVSAILRSADALGLHQVHLITGMFQPSAGAARGSERWLDLQRHVDTPSCQRWLAAHGYRLYVADLDPDALAPEDLPVDRPLAILFGSELAGVSPAARAAADGVVTLPMHGFVESLNVSVAAALILHTVAERRRAAHGPDLPDALRSATLERWLTRESHYAESAEQRWRAADIPRPAAPIAPHKTVESDHHG